MYIKRLFFFLKFFQKTVLFREFTIILYSLLNCYVKPKIMISTDERLDLLFEIYDLFFQNKDPQKLVDNNIELLENCTPADISSLVDRLVSAEISMDVLKSGIDRFMVILRPIIEKHPYNPPSSETYLGCLLENNRILDEKLSNIQPLLKQLNEFPDNQENKVKLIGAIEDLARFRSYYEIKESILFPEIRRHLSKNGCLSLMALYHDEIRKKLELALHLLSNPDLNLNEFNQLTNELLQIMYEVKFREERILFIIVQDSISESVLNALYDESLEIGFPYFQPEVKNDDKN